MTLGPNDALDPEQDTPEPRYVYISTGDDSDWLFLWDAVTGEQLSTRPEKNRHNLIELATSEGWEVVDGPLPGCLGGDEKEDTDGYEDWVRAYSHGELP